MGSKGQSPLVALFVILGLLSLLVFPAKESEPVAEVKGARHRILIVPGHNKIERGAEYLGVHEHDLNVALSHLIAERLRRLIGADVVVAQDGSGEWSPWLRDYVLRDPGSIARFRELARENYSDEDSIVKGGKHGYASTMASFDLYAVNKFANDNSFDVVLHVHFNDQARENYKEPGDYEGFAIYVPDSKIDDEQKGAALGAYLGTALWKEMKVSNAPREVSGLVWDHELIALGSNGSRDDVSILVEYSYIYEDWIRDGSVLQKKTSALAQLTSEAIQEYFIGIEK